MYNLLFFVSFKFSPIVFYTYQMGKLAMLVKETRGLDFQVVSGGAGYLLAAMLVGKNTTYKGVRNFGHYEANISRSWKFDKLPVLSNFHSKNDDFWRFLVFLKTYIYTSR